MNKEYYAIALLICLILLVSACKGSGAATGGAPRKPFIGGTAGITMNFLKDNPPPEVTDDESFNFNAVLELKNDGEFRVDKNEIRVNLVGFDPNDFGRTFDDLRDNQPDDNLESKKIDAEGNIIQGNPTVVTFPRGGGTFIPRKFSGNTEFTFRADACYHYKTEANTKLCILKDMINIRDNTICRPTSSRTIYSSSAPVQVQNFKQSVVGKDKLAFSFDIVLSGNVDIFWDRTSDTTPSSGFDSACPRDARARRERENNVKVEITEIPVDPVVTSLKCGGLDNGATGVVTLVSGRRTVTCTVELVNDRLDLEKTMGIHLNYNVLDDKDTKILIKHLAEG